MSGAYTTFEELARLAEPARRVPLYQPGAAKALMTGGHTSRMRGRGIDFEEYRGYQPGDDIRSIDWRASARTGKTLTRIYREERERPVLVVLDQSPGLFFGSRLNFKSVTAAQALALLGWKTLHNGDRIGALLSGLDNQGQPQHFELRPRRSRQHLLQILQHTAAMNQNLKAGIPAHQHGLDTMLASANRLSHPGALVVVISDFHNISPAGLKNMALLARHCDVMGIQVFDPLDFHLPTPGLYAISDGQQRGWLNTYPKTVRDNYSLQAEQRQTTLIEHLQRYRIPMLRLDSGLPTEEQMMTAHSPHHIVHKSMGGAGQ